MANQPHLQQCYKASVVDIWDIWQQLVFFYKQTYKLKKQNKLIHTCKYIP